MRTFVADGQTDRRTDGAGYRGPADRQGGSKKTLKYHFIQGVQYLSGASPKTLIR